MKNEREARTFESSGFSFACFVGLKLFFCKKRRNYEPYELKKEILLIFLQANSPHKTTVYF